VMFISGCCLFCCKTKFRQRRPFSTNVEPSNLDESLVEVYASTPRSRSPRRCRSKNQIEYSQLNFQQEIGQGGFGRVYMAMWQGTPVAVKHVMDMAPSAREALCHEFDIALDLRSPRITQVLGLAFDTSSNAFGVVMEYAPGGSLRSRLNRDGAPTYADSLLWALDIAEGMKYLHDQGVMHCDLKTPNVLLAHEHSKDRAKVADFGLARLDISTGLTSSTASLADDDACSFGTGTLKGSPPWMSPEAINGERSMHSDLYSYGIVLWELATGGVPWFGTPPVAVLYKVAVQDERPPMAADADHPLRPLIFACWDQHKDNRPNFHECVETLMPMVDYSCQATGIDGNHVW